MSLTPMQYVAKRLALGLGMMAIGAALAYAVALALLQDAAIAAGVFPEPGTRVIEGEGLASGPLWNAAKTLQTLANWTGAAGAVLVLAYGVVDRYGGELQEATQEEPNT